MQKTVRGGRDVIGSDQEEEKRIGIRHNQKISELNLLRIHHNQELASSRSATFSESCACRLMAMIAITRAPIVSAARLHHPFHAMDTESDFFCADTVL